MWPFRRWHASQPCPVPLDADGTRAWEAALAVAREDGSEYVGTDHLLLGMLDARGTRAEAVLAAAGVTAAAVRKAGRAIVPCGWGGSVPYPLPLTPRAEACLSAAGAIAGAGGAEAADSHDLLQALCREPECVAAEVLVRIFGQTGRGS